MDEERQKLAYILGMGMQLGLMIALTMAGLLVLGVYLDNFLGTKPLLMIAGIILGFLGAGLEMRYVVLPVLEKKGKAAGGDNGKNGQKREQSN